MRHQIPAAMFGALAEGNGGVAALRHLAAAEHSKNLLFLHGVVSAAEAGGHAGHGLARAAYDLLATIQEQAPDPVDDVLRYPAVGAWAGQTLLALRRGGLTAAAEPAHLAAVAAAAAIRARYPCTIEIPVTQRVLMLPSLGQATVPRHRDVVVLRSRSDGAELIAGRSCVLIPEIPHVDAPGWQGLRRIHARSGDTAIGLVIDDLDPNRMRAAALASRLTEAETKRWQVMLRAAWDILRENHAAVAAETSAALRVLVPLQGLKHGMRSASSRETFGSVGISAPPGPLALAVSLAHEVQHAKLSAVQDIVRLTEPDGGRRYYAPWREDPRPVSGLLQGAYAYLGVTRFWRRQRQTEGGMQALRAHVEYARWRSAVLSVTRDLLHSGQLTGTGQEFVATMMTVAQGWQDDPVPADAAELARLAAVQHAERWRMRHGPPP